MYILPKIVLNLWIYMGFLIIKKMYIGLLSETNTKIYYTNNNYFKTVPSTTKLGLFLDYTVNAKIDGWFPLGDK